MCCPYSFHASLLPYPTPVAYAPGGRGVNKTKAEAWKAEVALSRDGGWRQQKTKEKRQKEKAMQSVHPDFERMLWDDYRQQQYKRRILVIGIVMLAVCALLAAILVAQLAFLPLFLLPEHWSHTRRAVEDALRELEILRGEFAGNGLITALIDRAILLIKHNEFEQAQRFVGDIAELMHTYYSHYQPSVSVMDIYERLRMVNQVINYYKMGGKP